MKLRKKHVAIILALGMVLTSTGPTLVDKCYNYGNRRFAVAIR
nr:hypothetical protein [uncultured Peptostreptococcus sp.]